MVYTMSNNPSTCDNYYLNLILLSDNCLTSIRNESSSHLYQTLYRTWRNKCHLAEKKCSFMDNSNGGGIPCFCLGFLLAEFHVTVVGELIHNVFLGYRKYQVRIGITVQVQGYH